MDWALRDLLARRYSVPESASVSDVLSSLAERGLSATRIEEVKALLADVDFLRYAPQLGDYDTKIAGLRERATRALPRLA